MRLRAAVVGVGRVGSRFDEEPGRKTVWTHVGAYLARSEAFDLVGVCEPGGENATRFAARCPSVPIYSDIGEMMRATTPDVVSICTPAGTHAAVLDAVLAQPTIRLVWCEKPLADAVADAERMVAAAEKHGVHLVVSHVRRWTPLWKEASRLASTHAVGPVRAVRIAMPNRLFSIGSHALDLALMLGGSPAVVKGLAIPALHEEGEPAVTASILFKSGAYGLVGVTGFKRNLSVEGEITGDDGRITVREGREEIEIERFEPSARYSGYRELAAERTISREGLGSFSPFVAIVSEIGELVAGRLDRPTCSGRDALELQHALATLEGEVR